MIDVRKLRKRIGILGMLLPWIVSGLSLLYGYGFPKSISATYYLPNCIAPFMIILGSAGILLVCYKGYDKQDKIVCTLAGLFGIGICLFPCGLEKGMPIINVGTFSLPSNISAVLHNICAIAFFGLLAYNSVFLFTKSSGEMTPEKKKRNIIYKVCGYGMIGSFVLILPFALFQVEIGIWIVEAIALAFFGISWLTKSEAYAILCKDKE